MCLENDRLVNPSSRCIKAAKGPRTSGRPTSGAVSSPSRVWFSHMESPRITNVFLEHLAGRRKEWSATDMEHVSISIMLLGGGLCGMLFESKRIRNCLNETILQYHDHGSSDTNWRHPDAQGVSQPDASLGDPSPGSDDVVTLSRQHGVDHGAQAMGYSFGGICLGWGCNLYHALHQAPNFLPAHTSTNGDHCFFLSNRRWTDLYAERKYI